MPEYSTLTTDQLHDQLAAWQQGYDAADEIEDYDMRTQCVEHLSAISAELRQRGQLWIKLTDDDLLYRYRAGMALETSGIEEFAESCTSTNEEWRVEIGRRGLPVPTEYISLDEALRYFESNGHWVEDDSEDDEDENWWDWDDEFGSECYEPYEEYLPDVENGPSLLDDAQIEDAERHQIDLDDLPY